MTEYFKDDGRNLSDFFDHFEVICPQCQGYAQVRRIAEGFFAPVQFQCKSCGYSEEKSPRRLRYDADKDAYFGLSLWLKTTCCGQNLACYNREHLDYLKSFIAADIREEMDPDPEMGPYYRQRTLIRSLPAWLKAPENRDDILKALEQLAAKIT